MRINKPDCGKRQRAGGKKWKDRWKKGAQKGEVPGGYAQNCMTKKEVEYFSRSRSNVGNKDGGGGKKHKTEGDDAQPKGGGRSEGKERSDM